MHIIFVPTDSFNKALCQICRDGVDSFPLASTMEVRFSPVWWFRNVITEKPIDGLSNCSQPPGLNPLLEAVCEEQIKY